MDAKVKYIKGYKYQTVNDYTLFTGITPPKSLVFKWAILSDNGYLTIIHDYAWNGASGPTIDTENSIRASLVHDVLYQMIRLGFLDAKWKDRADELLYELCVEDGMFRVRAAIWKQAVKLFGVSSTLKDSEPEVLETP